MPSNHNSIKRNFFSVFRKRSWYFVASLHNEGKRNRGMRYIVLTQTKQWTMNKLRLFTDKKNKNLSCNHWQWTKIHHRLNMIRLQEFYLHWCHEHDDDSSPNVQCSIIKSCIFWRKHFFLHLFLHICFPLQSLLGHYVINNFKRGSQHQNRKRLFQSANAQNIKCTKDTTNANEN